MGRICQNGSLMWGNMKISGKHIIIRKTVRWGSILYSSTNCSPGRMIHFCISLPRFSKFLVQTPPRFLDNWNLEKSSPFTLIFSDSSALIFQGVSKVEKKTHPNSWDDLSAHWRCFFFEAHGVEVQNQRVLTKWCANRVPRVLISGGVLVWETSMFGLMVVYCV